MPLALRFNQIVDPERMQREEAQNAEDMVCTTMQVACTASSAAFAHGSGTMDESLASDVTTCDPAP